MILQDMYELYLDRGLDDVGLVIPGIFGIGVQTYGQQIPIFGVTPAGKPKIQYRSQPTIGETILSKIEGTPISPFNPEQQKALGQVKELQNITNAMDDTKTSFKQEIRTIALDNTLTSEQRKKKIQKAKNRFVIRIKRIDGQR